MTASHHFCRIQDLRKWIFQFPIMLACWQDQFEQILCVVISYPFFPPCPPQPFVLVTVHLLDWGVCCSPVPFPWFVRPEHSRRQTNMMGHKRHKCEDSVIKLRSYMCTHHPVCDMHVRWLCSWKWYWYSAALYAAWCSQSSLMAWGYLNLSMSYNFAVSKK